MRILLLTLTSLSLCNCLPRSSFETDVCEFDTPTPSMASPNSEANQEAGVFEGQPALISGETLFVISADQLTAINLKTQMILDQVRHEEFQDSRIYLTKSGVLSVQLGKENTHLNWWALTPKENESDFTLEQSHNLEVPNRLIDSRIVKDHLILVTSNRPNYQIHNPPPTMGNDLMDWGQGPCASQTASNFASLSISPPPPRNPITRAYSIPLLESSEGILEQGIKAQPNGIQTYLTKKSLYVFQSDYKGKSSIQLFDLPSLKAKGILHFEGQIKDRWAMKEFAEAPHPFFAVAITKNDSGRRVNQMLTFSLEQFQKEPIGQSELFGLTEDIRAIRFIENIAYVVTFKKTDPLYSFDLTNPKKIKILGELKVPGFSSFLHQISKSLLLGVGFDTTDQGNFALYQGIKLSIFDVSHPENLIETSTKIFGERGSSSEATFSAHSLFLEKDEKLVGVPLVQLKKTQGYRPELERSGFAILSYQSDELRELTHLSHQDWIPEHCQSQLTHPYWWSQKPLSLDIRRVIRHKEKIVAISPYAVSFHTRSETTAYEAQAERTILFENNHCVSF